MQRLSSDKLRAAYWAGLLALACIALCASVTIAFAAPTIRLPLIITTWVVSGAAAIVQTVLWRRSAKLLWRDRREGTAAAQTKHLAEVALLAGGFAHEARNALNALRSRIALLRKRVTDDDELIRRVDQVQEVGTSLEELVTDFLTFGRPVANELVPTSLNELVFEVLDFEQFELDQASVKFDVDIEPSAVVLVDRGKLKRAILNLVVNARQAMSDGGVLRIEGRVEKNRALLEVADEGIGIPNASLAKIFDTYYSTKSEGTGLGLAIVRQTIEGFGGSINCDSIEGRGTTMTVTLPLADKTPTGSEIQTHATLAEAGGQS